MDISSLNNYFELYGGMAIFIVVLLEYMNLPGFPAGIIMPLAGIYAAHGGIGLLAAIAISVLAGEVGSWILYFLGMYGGNAFLKIYLKRFPKHKPAFERTFDLIRRKGFYGIFISKLIPMVRTLISIPAGVLKMEFIKYSIASFLGVTLWNIPVVFTYHTRYEQYLHYLTPFGYLQNKANQGNLLGESILDFAQRQVIQRYLNHFLEKCDMVFAPTESIQNYLKPFHIDTPISIAPTGLPPACFENHIEATAIRKKYLQKKQYLFCTVSRLAKEKNLSFLLRGVSAVKKQLGDVFNVLILGDGPEKENLIALSQTLKIEENVFFIGEVSNHKISAYHQACDLFLFSSKSETQGIVLLEAMAAYLPVFAIRATGVSDVVVNGENGVLSSDSITEWADNLISILKNPAVLIKMRSSARTTALLYDEKSIANQILESYAYLKKSYEAEHWLMMHLNRTSYPVLAKEY